MASKPTERQVLNRMSAQPSIDLTVKELIESTTTIDEAAAMQEPKWVTAFGVLWSNEFMERAELAELGNYVLNANMVRLEHLDNPAIPIGMPQISWSLYVKAPVRDAVAGGPADDFAQAKRFARLAYQAVHGVVGKGADPARAAERLRLRAVAKEEAAREKALLTTTDDSKPVKTKAKAVRRRPQPS